MFSDMEEKITGKNLEGKLSNGDVLVGCGPKIKTIAWVPIHVWATGFYVDGAEAAKILSSFSKYTNEELLNNQTFYDAIIKGVL